MSTPATSRDSGSTTSSPASASGSQDRWADMSGLPPEQPIPKSRLPWIIAGLALVAVLTVAMFVPVKFVHPVRTERWRIVSLPMALAWTIFAGFAAWEGFDPVPVVFWGLMITSIYLLIAGAAQQAMYGRDG